MNSNDIKTFAEIGDMFDDATGRLLGGVSQQNSKTILRDLGQVQDGLAKLLAAHPEQLSGTAAIHVQNVIDQLDLEKAAVASFRNDPFAPKYINDVHRDLIDIVQGDETLAALANQNGHTGFQPVPSLLAPAAPFVGNAAQTAFMQDFVAKTQDFATRALTLADAGAGSDQVQQLVGEIQAFNAQADAFSRAQGGVYSARFNNEFADSGVNGTASRALIDGLQSGNAEKVHAAVEVLQANAADVSGNMLPNGSAPLDYGSGIPASVQSLAEAGAIFNDATTKLIGGVYAGNRQSLHDDLTAVQQGVSNVLASGELAGQSAKQAARIVDLLGKEISAIDAGGTTAQEASQIHKLHSRIIDIVQQDGQLSGAAAEGGANGFMQLPDGSKRLGEGSQMAAARGDSHDAAAGDHGDHLAHIFDHGSNLHHHG